MQAARATDESAVVARRRERRAFLLGAAAVLLAGFLVARLHVAEVRGRYAPVVEAPEPIDINRADEATLTLLEGVGPARARAIVAWRREHGPFRTWEDLMAVEGIGRGKRLGVEFDGGMGAVDPRATTGRLLGAPAVRGTVGAEKEFGVPAGGRSQQGPAMPGPLEHRQAIEVWANAAGEQGVAVVKQVVRGEGRRQAVWTVAYECHGLFGGDVFQDDAQLREIVHERA